MFIAFIALFSSMTLLALPEPVELSFNEVISLALENYEDIQLEHLKQSEAHVDYYRNRSTYTPIVEINSNLKYSRNESPDRSLGFNIKQPIIDLPKLYTIKASSSRFQEIFSQSEYAVDRLLFEIGQCYLEVIQKEEIYEIQMERFLLAQKQVQATQDAKNSSSTQKADIIRAESELSKAKRLILESQEEYDSKRYELATLIGLDHSNVCLQHLDIDWDILFENEGEISNLIDQALCAREDLKGLYYRIVKASDEVKAQKSRRLPTLCVKGKTEWDIDHHNTSCASLKFAMPLYHQKIKFDEYDKRFKKTRAILEYRKLKKEIAIALTNLWRRARTELTRWESTREEVIYEKKNYIASKDLFEKGQESSLDMINVINRYTDAKINVVNNEISFYVAIWDLYTQLGEFHAFIENHLRHTGKTSCSDFDLEKDLIEPNKL